ncbi:MAG TPA: serine hydrolase [Flavisolibacter sp.]|nr:serine hydrolase [Flavisolibacter sp.]
MNRLFFLLLFYSSIAHTQVNKTALIDKYMKAQEKVNGFSGVVMITKNGKALYKQAFGYANREWNILNTTTTTFRIASITKQFTAVAILQLIAAGKLALHDPLSRFYPDFPRGDSVTIHMLLNHTSGIKSFTAIQGFSKLEFLSLPKDSIVALFSKEPYDFTPGSRYSYNNSAYFLLATIIEKLSGLDYDTYLKTNIFSKSKLKHTGVEKTDSIMLHNATGYRYTPRGWKKSKPISMEFPLGGGNLVSTVDDLLLWQNTLFNRRILPDSLFFKMATPYLNRYGYALDIDSLGQHKRIGHDGNISGFGSYCYYYPADSLSVIVLSNKQGNIQWLGQALAATVFDMPMILPYSHKEIKIDPILLEPYIGTYETPEKNIIEIVKQEDKLFRKAGNVLTELKPESQTKFFFANATDAQVFFEKRANSYEAFIVRDGLVSPLKKIK